MGKTHRFGGTRNIKLGQHDFHPVVQIGAGQTPVTTLIESLEPAVLEAPYHGQGVMCLSTLVNKMVCVKLQPTIA